MKNNKKKKRKKKKNPITELTPYIKFNRNEP